MLIEAVGYAELNHPPLDKIEINRCYLCDNELNGEDSPDHLIPNSLFPSGSDKKPILPVHEYCNASKSKEDEWFIRSTQLMASLNKEASDILTEKLLSKALDQKRKLSSPGERIRDYKLAVSLLDKNKWGDQVDGNSVLYVGKENAERTSKYMKQLCKGLYLRNVLNASVKLPELTGVQFAASIAQGTYSGFAQSVTSLTRHAMFFQDWGGRISYSGSCVREDINKGFIYVELYGEVGYLAYFK